MKEDEHKHNGDWKKKKQDDKTQDYDFLTCDT